jgi:hypothetical protein
MFKELEWSTKHAVTEPTPGWYLVAAHTGHKYFYDLTRKLFIWQVLIEPKHQYTAPLPNAINK